MKSLRLAKDLSLPLDAVTQTFLIVGKRGSGKSNTAARFVEQLHHARLPFVVLDPVDTWWGLKAGRDGDKGLDVYVFGGRRADLPLEAGGGALIADVLCEHRMSMVLSVKHLSGRERSTFMVAFAQTLFQKWAGGPLCVVLEEAHELAPQSAQNGREGEQQMLGAFKRLWKLGRASGIGGVAITQRPASLSKDITTQSEILIAHRTIGPQDVKAVGEWVKYHGERLDILAELPSLPTGEAYVWAPEFPEGKAIGLQRTSILLRETYDSASTPKVGEQRVEPKELAEVDLERLRLKMAATIEKAKADDPRELRRQIAELKKQVAQKDATLDEVDVRTKRIDEKLQRVKPAAVLTDADRALLTKLAEGIGNIREFLVHGHQQLFDEAYEKMLKVVHTFRDDSATDITKMRAEFERRLESKGFQKILGKLAAVPPTHIPPTTNAAPRSPLARRVAPALAQATSSRPARQVPALSNGHGDGDASVGNSGLRRMLIALAQRPQGLTRARLGIRAGLSPKTGTFATYLGRLRSNGWVSGDRSQIQITDAGLKALGTYDPLPTGPDLAAYWMQELGGGMARMLQAALNVYPQTISREAMGQASNLSDKTGSFATYLGRLRSLELIEGRGEIRASEELFS